jgi:DNA polymerase III delta prime subunit
MAINTLWTEKYRPDTVNGYVFKDSSTKGQVSAWIQQKSIPNLLFSGAPGTGKTTLAKILINELGVNFADILEINASRTNSVEHVRDMITRFVTTMPFGDFRVVLLDEADYLSKNAQAALRGVMEQYSDSARFILTCNYSNMIIPALHSRCQTINIERLDDVEFTSRAAEILITEQIAFELETLDSVIKATYPDLRKCINTLQMSSISGRLVIDADSNKSTADYRLDAVVLFKQRRYREGRKLICDQVRPEEVEDVFRWCYDNLGLWSETDEGQDRAIVIIRNGIVNHSMVSDTEINLSATLTELSQIE